MLVESNLSWPVFWKTAGLVCQTGLFCGVCIWSAQAEVLISRAPYTNDRASALFSDFDLIPTNVANPPISQQVADNFTSLQPMMATDVGWWGFYSQSGPAGTATVVQFHVRFFADSGGKPVIQPFYDATVSASFSPFAVVQSVQTFSFSAVLPQPVNLNGLTRYWFSVVESDPATTDDRFRWFMAAGPQVPVGFAVRAQDGANWTAPGNVEHLAFVLHGSVIPEPSGIVLIGSALVAIILIRFIRSVYLR